MTATTGMTWTRRMRTRAGSSTSSASRTRTPSRTCGSINSIKLWADGASLRACAPSSLGSIGVFLTGR